MSQTNKPFVLPNGRGFKAELGTKISGTMRQARVKDFLDIQRDTRHRKNPGLFYVIMLSRVVEKIGTERVNSTATISKLSPEDFSFLLHFFNEINHGIIKHVPIQCACGESFIREVHLPGEV